MTARRAFLLLLCALLLGGGVLLVVRRRAQAPALEGPSAPSATPPVRAEPESRPDPPVDRTPALEMPEQPAARAPRSEDLHALGARRGWQLPIGKGWWTDALINPTRAEPDGKALADLQERVLSWADRLLLQKRDRKQRFDDYCNERIAAGLALEDSRHEIPVDGKEHAWINVHTLADPSRTFRVDVGAGDDAQLDELDRQIASTWSAAVEDLRARFAVLQR